MSHIQNTVILESAQEDFDQFLSQKNWKNCHAIIDNLYETGFEHEGMILAKALAKAQYESGLSHREKVAELAEKRKQEILSRPMVDEVEEGEPMDMRDLADRSGTYPY